MKGTAKRPPALTALVRRYTHAGTPLTCDLVPRGLLNRGWRISTTRGRFFLKQYLSADTADPAIIVRQHRATRGLARLGLPAAAPLADADGGTVTVVDGKGYALFPWIDGRHREGTELSEAQSRRLGALLGLVHTGLARVQPPPPAERHPSADADRTHAEIDHLLALVRRHRPRDSFDALAERRLLERRTLLRQHAHACPPAAEKWVLNSRVLYWVDLGNNASSGQFVLGQPKNSANRKRKDRLPTVAELYPEILKGYKKEDDQPSCSAAEALTRQEPFINQSLAYQALGMLTQLLRQGSISYQGGFSNLVTGQLVPLPVRVAEPNSEPQRCRTSQERDLSGRPGIVNQ